MRFTNIRQLGTSSARESSIFSRCYFGRAQRAKETRSSRPYCLRAYLRPGRYTRDIISNDLSNVRARILDGRNLAEGEKESVGGGGARWHYRNKFVG